MSTKTKPAKAARKPRPRYRVQLVKSKTTGLWYNRIVGANGEKISASKPYDAKDSSTSKSNASRTAYPLAEALGTSLEIKEVAE